MNPELIQTYRQYRGFPSWHEYARVMRVVHVEQRKVGIGMLYRAYLPDGQVVADLDVAFLVDVAAAHGCPRIEVVAA